MKKLIFVDTILLGSFTFKAYIFEIKLNKIAYGIFIESMQSPLLWMQKDNKDEKIRITFDEDLVQYITSTSKASKRQRKLIAQELIKFIVCNEKKAANLVFKEENLEYLINHKEIVLNMNYYINGAKSN